MQTEITDDLTLAEVQQIFTQCYPHARLAFFQRDLHGLVKKADNTPSLSGDHFLGEFRLDKIDDGALDLRCRMTTSQLIRYFDSTYSLHAELSHRENAGPGSGDCLSVLPV